LGEKLEDNLWLLSFSSYNTSRPLAPSSREIRYKPFFGVNKIENPKDEEMKGNKG
jgi:hypothetical protein